MMSDLWAENKYPGSTLKELNGYVAMPSDTVSCDTVPSDTVSCDTVSCDTVPCDTVTCGHHGSPTVVDNQCIIINNYDDYEADRPCNHSLLSLWRGHNTNKLNLKIGQIVNWC